MDGAIPPGGTEPNLAALREMGYDRLDLSWLVAARWNEPGSEVVLREMSLAGAGMGAVTLRGVFGGVTGEVFKADPGTATVALLGATAKRLDLTVENAGLFEHALGQEARKQSKTPEELRSEYGLAAAIAVPAVLGPSPAAKAIAQAAARFIAKPGRLSLSARTKDPAGLGIADFPILAEPALLLDRLEVAVTAE